MSGNSHFDRRILALELEGLRFFMQLAERKGPIRTKQLQLKLRTSSALFSHLSRLLDERSCKHFQTKFGSITCYPKMPPKGRDGPSYWFNRPGLLDSSSHFIRLKVMISSLRMRCGPFFIEQTEFGSRTCN